MLSDNLRGFNIIPVSLIFLSTLLLPAIAIYPLALQLYNLVNAQWLFPAVIYFSFLGYTFMFLAQCYIILKIIYNPKEKEGTYNLNDINPAVIYNVIFELLIRTLERLFYISLIPQALYGNLIFNLFAKHAGKRCLINPMRDPYLTSMGDDCIIGYGALIIGHEIVGKRLILKEVKIGSRVTIGANSIISCGTVIEDDVVVGANSFVMKYSVLKKGGFYVGNPAVLKERKK